MDLEEVKRKAQKLMQFTEGRATPEECEIAAKKLKDLLTKYQLDLADLKNGKTNEATKEKDAFTANMIHAWEGTLIHVISKAYDCCAIQTTEIQEVITSFGKARRKVKVIKIIGKVSDIECSGYMVDFLRNNLTLAAEEEAAKYTKKSGDKLKFKNAYIIAAAVAVGKRLEEEKAVAKAANERDLMVIKGNEVQEFVKQRYPRMSKIKSKAGADGLGKMLGREKGQTMGLNRGVNTGGAKGQLK